MKKLRTGHLFFPGNLWRWSLFAKTNLNLFTSLAIGREESLDGFAFPDSLEIGYSF